MAFENLSEKISAVFKKLRSKGKLSEADVKTSMREIRMALLEADVNYKVAKNLINDITEKAIGSDIMESLTPAQAVVKIVNESLTSLMGGSSSRINIPSRPPCIIMMCGLQGAGKTTHCAKLSKMFKKKGHRPLIVACDVYRPAAIKQLEVLCNSVGVNVYQEGKASPIGIAKHAVSYAKDHGNDIVIIDTAGRLHIDNLLMDELLEIKKAISPHEILLTVDAMTGQDAVNVSKTFDEKINITGVIITKMDGDARGGAALSIKAITGKPIKFVGMGEKLDDIEVFHPDRMASRILGMGDVLTLIEDAQINFDKKQASKMVKKLEENSFDLNDLASQFMQIKKMGSLRGILGKLPGMGKHMKELDDMDDKIIDRTCAMIFSMTPQERKKPSIINPSRKKRIAKGSGMRVEDVNKLLRHFEQMQKMMKQFGNKNKFKFPRFRLPNIMKFNKF